MLLRMDIATVYHDIRGQSVMKLYVIFNVLEVLERLCSAFGEDILDSLFSSITKSQAIWKVAIMLLGSMLYVFLHALVHFYFATTLSVALAAGDNGALFSVLMASNFVELKGSVFKKFDPENLFQITCSDIVERFRLIVYVGVVIVQNTSYHKANEWYNQMGQDILLIGAMELVVDWIKHSFICKFNSLNASGYASYSQASIHPSTLSCSHLF